MSAHFGPLSSGVGVSVLFLSVSIAQSMLVGLAYFGFLGIFSSLSPSGGGLLLISWLVVAMVCCTY